MRSYLQTPVAAAASSIVNGYQTNCPPLAFSFLFSPFFFLPFLKYFILFFFSSYFFSPSSVSSLLCDSACLALEINRICLISLSRVMSLDDRKYCMLFGDSFLQFSPTRNSCHLHGWNVL